MPKLSKSAPKKAKAARMKTELHKFKTGGTLHSGSKKGPLVKSRKQAIAIGMSESGQSRPAEQKKPQDLKRKHDPKAKAPKKPAAMRRVRNKGRS